jgi:N utilization substance protein B
MGIAELLAFPQTDAAVVIDEALEIAKRFSSPDSFQFINGVLDAVRKGLPRQ